MKLFLVLLTIVGAYCYLLLHTTNVVLGQTQQLGNVYRNAGNYAQSVASKAE